MLNITTLHVSENVDRPLLPVVFASPGNSDNYCQQQSPDAVEPLRKRARRTLFPKTTVKTSASPYSNFGINFYDVCIGKSNWSR